ncbi:hypothetical protein CIK79_00175 [Brevibacterium aurantiacum]|uniref:Uncharacterized protein n=1 Tax=Brevibacterium aurantiacum TaxID=273384 RepID=A0A2A3WZ08_BREAU|nr:hypothetical protein CIK79_00175 [Brevibacterium aurantiacum]
MFWMGITGVTFLLLGVFPQAEFSAMAAPIFIAGAVVALCFFVGLVWKPWSDVQSWLDRVELLMRWQVASGVVITFTIAFQVREELRLAFSLFGMYLIMSGVLAVMLSLIAVRLRALYCERERLAEATQRQQELDEVKRLISLHRRPRILWPWHRQKHRGTENHSQ